MRELRREWSSLLAFCLVAGCASSTAFVETWRNPAFNPSPLDGQKILALVISPNDALRRTAEDTLAAEITQRGGQGIAAWTILPTAETKSEEKSRASITASGAVAVVTMEIVDLNQARNPPGVRVGWRWTDHGSFWPHYNDAWGVAWSGGPAPRADVLVETSIHTLDPDELIWAGRSKSTNVESSATLFAQVAAEAAREVQRSGLLKSTAH